MVLAFDLLSEQLIAQTVTNDFQNIKTKSKGVSHENEFTKSKRTKIISR
jgi:hypothetical protein